MVLYSGIITLDYDLKTDVLFTSMPDVRKFGMSEVSFCLDRIVESIRHYDIKNLLLDASNSIIEVDDAAYKTVITKFTLDLMQTRLQKFARVEIRDKVRERKTVALSLQLIRELNLSILLKNFTNQNEALDWLTQTEEQPLLNK